MQPVSCFRGDRAPPRRRFPVVGALVTLVLLAGALSTEGLARGGKPHSKTKDAPTHKGKAKPPPAVAAEAKPVLPPKGKVAVFMFTGDAAVPIRKEVLRLLQAKGLKVVASIRPVDSPEQFREMAETLDLIAYVTGETEVDGDEASATVHVRSGASGLRLVSATFSGDKRKLSGELGRALWDQIAPSLSKATVDAAGPRRHDRAPMRIEAGTPIESSPAEAEVTDVSRALPQSSKNLR